MHFPLPLWLCDGLHQRAVSFADKIFFLFLNVLHVFQSTVKLLLCLYSRRVTLICAFSTLPDDDDDDDGYGDDSSILSERGRDRENYL